MIALSALPAVNACLNTTTAALLVLGYLFIRRKIIRAHKICMLSACATSALFLTSYLYYHSHHGMTRFSGQGFIRPVYFALLISHTFLAAVILPLVATTLFWALRGRLDKHARIARVTLPIWLYVSVTGVVVYWMLYHLKEMF